jgi:hypothetical protein
MYRIRRIFRGSIRLVFDEVVLCDHFNIGILRVDSYWSSKGYSDGSITGEESPPNSFPEPLV